MIRTARRAIGVLLPALLLLGAIALLTPAAAG